MDEPDASPDEKEDGREHLRASGVHQRARPDDAQRRIAEAGAYVGERKTITAEDVEQIATHTAECTVFAMVDALVDGQAERAFSLLNVLLEGGEQRIGVMGQVHPLVAQNYGVDAQFYCAELELNA